mmetsp:Transcript_99695/g.168198  ORF Transcript_99695/g.168198 Transcript_99695/m.168198 type:complete len:255 (-) Transcript_99695:411-1175(-)
MEAKMVQLLFRTLASKLPMQFHAFQSHISCGKKPGSCWGVFRTHGVQIFAMGTGAAGVPPGPKLNATREAAQRPWTTTPPPHHLGSGGVMRLHRFALSTSEGSGGVRMERGTGAAQQKRLFFRPVILRRAGRSLGLCVGFVVLVFTNIRASGQRLLTHCGLPTSNRRRLPSMWMKERPGAGWVPLTRGVGGDGGGSSLRGWTAWQWVSKPTPGGGGGGRPSSPQSPPPANVPPQRTCRRVQCDVLRGLQAGFQW